jgi:5'-3' exonuclease
MGLTLLIDSSSMLYRAYFSVPDSVRTTDGRQINGAYGFINMLARLVADLRPTRMACALDVDWRPDWRVELIDSYKAHRVAEAESEATDNIEWQIEMAAELLDLAGVAVVGSSGYEAEDVIGALLPGTRGDVAIVSGDRDLFQLVRDPRIWVLYPRRGVSDLIRVDEAEIARKYGIPGRAYADFAILRGDPSDGLPGVRGIGEKTATQLIAKHGSLAEVVRAARGATSGPLAKVAASTDYLDRAAKVVRIGAEAPIGKVDLTLPRHPPDRRLKAKERALALGGPMGRFMEALEGRA